MAILTSEADLERLRRSGWILATALKSVAVAAKPGVTTADLDYIAEAAITTQGGIAPFRGYQGFPAALCTSINEEIVHGIPSPHRRLKKGDIIGLDLGVVYEGIYTDQAVTVPVGRITPAAARLIADTRQSLQAGLSVIRAGRTVGDISAAVQSFLEPKGYGVVRQLTGHGVGRAIHEQPSIPNFGRAKTGPVLQAGMVLAIEPMVTLGDWVVRTREDGWTAVTADGSLGAHFEDTILVTKNGYELITTTER